ESPRGRESRARHEDAEGHRQRGPPPCRADAEPPRRPGARYAGEDEVAGPEHSVALTHLADTSVLTRLGHRAVRAALEPLAASGQVARAGIADLEVGFSARNLGEWTRLVAALAAFPLIETDAVHVRRARQVQRLLASRGLRGRKVPDLLIAAAAGKAALPSFTTTRISI